eukprot:gene30978-38840_t
MGRVQKDALIGLVAIVPLMLADAGLMLPDHSSAATAQAPVWQKAANLYQQQRVTNNPGKDFPFLLELFTVAVKNLASEMLERGVLVSLGGLAIASYLVLFQGYDMEEVEQTA